MGSGSSIPSNENVEKEPTRKSIKGEFEKEFGKTFEEDVDENNVPQSSKNQIVINPAIFRAKRLFMKPIVYQRPKVDNLVVKKQNNGALLKEMYRRMDPTITTLSTQVIVGDVEIAAKYKMFDKTLLLKVGRAKNLHKDGIGMPDPFVSVDLFPASDPSKVLTRKTAMKSNTCNPIFQEILLFPLAERQIADTRLRVTLWDKDVITQDDFMGESIIQLCKLDLNVGNTMWYKLHPRTDVLINGSLDVTIVFNEPNNVIVTINQAYDLKNCNANGGTSNPSVRLYVTGLPNKEETKIIENSLDPEWNESYEFTLHPDEFSRRIIVLNVVSKDRDGGRDVRLGDVQIPLLDFDSQHSGMRRNYMLQDLRNTPQSRSKWSEEGLAMEFREAMKAHAIYGYPKFFFKKVHRGKQVVSCRSKKARSEARMIISNGIPSLDEVQM